jgi:hypothetical protein
MGKPAPELYADGADVEELAATVTVGGKRGWQQLLAVDDDESDLARRDNLQGSECRPHGNDWLDTT